jgi:uncharacterized iron-regulated membrane protein
MGQEYGLPNQLLMVATCIVIVLMSVSALVMWWMRRPQGSLGAPRYPEDYRIPRTILLIALLVGIAFPLVGVSILVMLLIDLFLPLGLHRRLA